MAIHRRPRSHENRNRKHGRSSVPPELLPPKPLSRCESNLRDFRVASKIAFYVHIARAALWRADDAWLSDVFRFLEAHYSEIPAHLESDMELTFQLNLYRESSAEFLNGDPVRAGIHSVIRDYCSKSDAEAERSYMECQSRLANDATAVLRAFPLDDQDYRFMLNPWTWIAEDICERLDLATGPVNKLYLKQQIFNLMKEIDGEENDNWWLTFNLGRAALHGLAYVLFAVGPLLLLLSFGGGPAIFSASASVGSVCVLIYHFWLKPRSLDKSFDRMIQRRVRRNYLTHWRGKIVRFLSSTSFPMDDVERGVLEVLQEQFDALSASTWLFQFLVIDYGLTFYCLAKRSMR